MPTNFCVVVSGKPTSMSRAGRLLSFYAPEAASLIGSRIEGSSFSGLLTRVEIGHIRFGSAGTAVAKHEDQARR
jgi:malonyl CoA-acyl carrier protein transacylase